jgi:hypothetical protein
LAAVAAVAASGFGLGWGYLTGPAATVSAVWCVASSIGAYAAVFTACMMSECSSCVALQAELRDTREALATLRLPEAETPPPGGTRP